MDCFGGAPSLKCGIVYENDFIQDFQSSAMPLTRYKKLMAANKACLEADFDLKNKEGAAVTAFAAQISSKPHIEPEEKPQDFIWMQSEAEIIYQAYEPSNSL